MARRIRKKKTAVGAAALGMDTSPVSIKAMIGTDTNATQVVTDVLNLLGEKGLSFYTAQVILAQSQEALSKCTIIHTNYSS